MIGPETPKEIAVKLRKAFGDNPQGEGPVVESLRRFLKRMDRLEKAADKPRAKPKPRKTSHK